MTDSPLEAATLTPGRFWVLCAVITLGGIILRMHGITQQPPIYDEVLAAVGADNYVEHGLFGPIMVDHPQWRSLALRATMQLFGSGAIGLRASSLLLGSITIPLLMLLIASLTRSRLAALLAGFSLALDPVHITFSRQAIQEVHTTFFFLAGVLLFVEGARRTETSWVAVLWPLSGAAFGLGLASKAHALFPLAMCGALSLWQATGKNRSPSLTALAVASFAVLPLSVYLLTFLPWFARGYGLGDWLFMQRALVESMVTHTGNPMDSMVDTTAALWFVKPFMGYGNFVEVGGTPMVTIAMGNPLVWLLVLPAAIFTLARRREDRGSMMLLVLFLASYLPLALTTRPVWVLSSLAVTPFAFGLVALAAGDVVRTGRQKIALGAFLAAVLIVSLLMYPMSVGKGWHHEYLRPLVVKFMPH
jgi:dolichyl-phosphate-mannose--protein O-mannosyl transferase